MKTIVESELCFIARLPVTGINSGFCSCWQTLEVFLNKAKKILFLLRFV